MHPQNSLLGNLAFRDPIFLPLEQLHVNYFHPLSWRYFHICGSWEAVDSLRANGLLKVTYGCPFFHVSSFWGLSEDWAENTASFGMTHGYVMAGDRG